MENNNKLAEVIKGEMKKVARNFQSGTHQETTTIELDDVELVIDGNKKLCDISLDVYVTFHWWYNPGTYWQPPEGDIDKIEYEIEEMTISDKDGVIYTKEQEKKILNENYNFLHDYIEDEVEEAARDMDTSYDNEFPDED